MICAIHQPNFFPWLGYFDKISRVDVFIFLDKVDYEKSGSSMQCYTNRVGILRGGRSSWIHCPVIREHGAQSIDSVKINDKEVWREKIKTTIGDSYKTARFYDEIAEYIFSLVDFNTEYLADYNIYIISELVKKLDLNTKLVRQDQFETQYHSTRLLVELVKDVNCDSYLFGGGGKKYQQNELFEEAGIRLIEQNYHVPNYKQISEPFVAGLSILDTLFHCGFEGTKQLLDKKKRV